MASSHNLVKSHRMSLEYLESMADTQRQRLEAREEAILAAATAVFGESGVDGARMAEIARRADVAEGTVYLYYKNKHELLEAARGSFLAS